METEPLAAEEMSNKDFVKGALATIDILDEKVERVDARLEQIEVRMKELRKRGEEAERVKMEKEVSKKRKIREEDGNGPKRSERLRPKRAGGGQVGKGVLLLSMLGMFVTRGEAKETSSPMK